MDMITTGKTALDRDLVFKLTEQLRVLLGTRTGQHLSIPQLRQVILKEMNPDGGDGYHRGGGGSGGQYASYNEGVNVTVSEVEEAVRELETEGFLQYIPRTKTVILRAS